MLTAFDLREWREKFKSANHWPNFSCRGAKIEKGDASTVGMNFEQGNPGQETTGLKECTQHRSNIAAVENKQKLCSQRQDSSQNSMADILSSVADKQDGKPKPVRKRSSSLSDLWQLKQFLEDNQYERIKLRRVSSIPMSSKSDEQETQLEDGLLTTTLCSTEL